MPAMVYGRPPARRPTPEQIASNIAKGIEDAAEALRWCKAHLHDRKAPDTLRLVQMNIANLAMALDSQMEGETERAESAVDRVWWQPQRETDSPDVPPKD